MPTSTATPPASTTSPPPLGDGELADLAVQALDAALSSASVDVIGVSSWWERATAALVAAGAAGSSWPRVCSTLARKLQIEAYSERDARALAGIGARLDDAALGRWCYLAQRDAPYLVAMCRIVRSDRAAARGKTAPTPTAVGTLDLISHLETS